MHSSLLNGLLMRNSWNSVVAPTTLNGNSVTNISCWFSWLGLCSLPGLLHGGLFRHGLSWHACLGNQNQHSICSHFAIYTVDANRTRHGHRAGGMRMDGDAARRLDSHGLVGGWKAWRKQPVVSDFEESPCQSLPKSGMS